MSKLSLNIFLMSLIVMKNLIKIICNRKKILQTTLLSFKVSVNLSIKKMKSFLKRQNLSIKNFNSYWTEKKE